MQNGIFPNLNAPAFAKHKISKNEKSTASTKRDSDEPK
jgi:hypothetical protein